MKIYSLRALTNVLELVSDKIKMINWDFNHRGTTLFNKHKCNISSYSILSFEILNLLWRLLQLPCRTWFILVLFKFFTQVSLKRINFLNLYICSSFSWHKKFITNLTWKRKKLLFSVYTIAFISIMINLKYMDHQISHYFFVLESYLILTILQSCIRMTCIYFSLYLLSLPWLELPVLCWIFFRIL